MIEKTDLSKKVTILDKNPLIIKGSLLDNIALGLEKEMYDKKKILSLVSQLNLNNIFNDKNIDLENIEENGKNLSLDRSLVADALWAPFVYLPDLIKLLSRNMF